ncbi:MAG: thermonuclease family protein [Hyphomicrobiales bacterium]|nr:thermonuclease family protein [Hyphomicrobiales bacterium]
MRPGRGWRRAPAPPRGFWRWVWDAFLTVAVLGLLILLAARLDRTEPRTLEGRVIVNDGDSLTIGSERIRLRGIDAPEFDQTCRGLSGDYPCGRRAREALAALIGGRAVSCAGSGRDKYDRLLAVCSAATGRELNRSQVEAGWAIAYGGYEAEQDDARRKRAGIWAGSFDPPRDWRDMHGGMVEIEHAAPGGILAWLRRILRLS